MESTPGGDAGEALFADSCSKRKQAFKDELASAHGEFTRQLQRMTILEAIGPSWAGVSGLLQQARRIEDEFTKESLAMVLAKVKERSGVAPD